MVFFWQEREKREINENLSPPEKKNSELADERSTTELQKTDQ